jgi:hypothetical protein
MEILELVADYVSQGLAIFPCRGKTPLIPGGFKNASKDPEVVAKWWTRWPDANVGLATGAPSGFFVLDVDLKPGKDGAASLKTYTDTHGELPPTRVTRTPSGGWHYWFVHPTAGGYSTVERLGKGLDTRGDGGYVIIPPSKGLNGGEYTWENPTAPFAEVPAWVLEGIAKRGPGRPTVAGAAASENGKPQKRQAVKITKQVPAVDIESALAAIDPSCPYQQWVEIGMALHAWDAERGLALWDTWSRPGKTYQEGACAEKWASFGSSDGIGVGTVIHHAKAAGWIGPAGKEIALYNQDHAVVLVSGKCRVIKEVPTTNGRVELDFLGVNDFTDYNKNRIAWSVSPTGKPVKTYTASEWLEWKGRRSFEGLTFAPSGKCPPHLYNMFRGFGVEPAAGDWSLMRAHVLDVICSGDEALYGWLEAWLARIVQDPGGERPGTAVVLKGGQGTGKGMFVSHFGKIIGPHYVHLTHQEQLTSKFNSQLKDALVVFADEACYPGDKAAVGRLKGLVTEHTITIEPKGVNAFSVANHVNLLMASNESWVIPADWDDRRFLVLEVSTAKKQDHAYFQKLKDQMDAGGLAAWLHHLLTVDTTAANLHNPPKTEARAAQIVAGLPLPELYWYECVQDGRVKTADADGRDTTSDRWPEDADKDQMYAGFVAFCGERRVRHVPTKSWFYRQLQPHGIETRYKRGTTGDTERRMEFPPLDDMRLHWNQTIGARGEKVENSR